MLSGTAAYRSELGFASGLQAVRPVAFDREKFERPPWGNPVTLVESASVIVQLCWLRAWLPHTLAARPLDAVLRELSPGRNAGDFEKVQRALDRAEALADGVPWLRRSCLYRELARYAVFRRFGCEPVFVLAVHPNGVEQDGHAWLEFGGVPYREPRAHEFVVSFRFPAAGSGS